MASKLLTFTNTVIFEAISHVPARMIDLCQVPVCKGDSEVPNNLDFDFSLYRSRPGP